jgi:hypothetical protein
VNNDAVRFAELLSVPVAPNLRMTAAQAEQTPLYLRGYLGTTTQAWRAAQKFFEGFLDAA